MTKHVFRIEQRLVVMTVVEREDEIICTLLDASLPMGIQAPQWPIHQYDFVYDWFNAVIVEVRTNSCKCIHLFDRQHVMTS